MAQTQDTDTNEIDVTGFLTGRQWTLVLGIWFINIPDLVRYQSQDIYTFAGFLAAMVAWPLIIKAFDYPYSWLKTRLVC